MKPRTCSIPDCDRPIHGKGLCNAHYRRLRRHGDPLAGTTPIGKALEFFHNVVLPYDGDDCLIWPFSRDRGGYAQLGYNGRTASVHRLVCEHVHGRAPTPKHDAAHTCGNATCCNPRHLRWATRAKNEADKIIHGTTNRGERCGAARLSESDVLIIRAIPGTQSEIAEKFGVTQSMVSLIKSGRRWQHITEEISE